MPELVLPLHVPLHWSEPSPDTTQRTTSQFLDKSRSQTAPESWKSWKIYFIFTEGTRPPCFLFMQCFFSCIGDNTYGRGIQLLLLFCILGCRQMYKYRTQANHLHSHLQAIYSNQVNYCVSLWPGEDALTQEGQNQTEQQWWHLHLDFSLVCWSIYFLII